MKRFPLITLLLVAANVCVYLLETPATCQEFGLVPARFTHGGAPEPLLTSLFLHDPGSLAHIAGNMAFLAIFGTIVEGGLGGIGFLVLYLVAGVAGGLCHTMVNPGATDALVGASGAIFGVMAVAGVLRPRLLGFVVAFGALNVWQAFVGGAGNVSFGCHIGGLCAGVVVAMLLRVSGSEALEVT